MAERKLDPKGLEAAASAVVKKVGGPFGDGEPELVAHTAITAYLDSTQPPDIERTSEPRSDLPITKVARAQGLAQAIAECRDDARLDGIREGASEIVRLLGGSE